ncbi:MAG: phosphoribosylamine--glycine ligase [Candidatus Liptonbacteria bacterium]|nr:phosphoribosylamine--glycine ligase [Candidatus Liptonbacteria bacterium]
MPNVLIIGGGGREHALAWKLAQSPRVKKIYVAPGNGGVREIAENIPIISTDIKALVEFAREKKIGLAVVGPDDALALGIVDEFKNAGIPVFGPTKAAAEIEASKAFAKSFMKTHAIPTAGFEVFKEYEKAKEYLERSEKFPLVVKASGLALGKGVVIAKTKEEADAALRSIMLDKIFGESGNEVVIEEFLQGKEISIHAVSDGATFQMFPAAQDHKRVFDGDKGPNTGGMGTIAPLPWMTTNDMNTIAESIVEPTLRGLRDAGRPFGGILYPGLMMTNDGPKVLEFNARFGDPETQTYMVLLKTDLVEIIESCVAGKLKEQKIEWHSGYAACVVLASGGYPGKYEKGKKITGLEEAKKIKGVELFHAGTVYENGEYYTAGGRVLGVTARAETLRGALNLAYEAAAKIRFNGMHYRKDIGAKAL